MQCKSIEDMIAETRRRTWIKIINRLMESIGYTPQQAMDLLEIPTEERPLVLEKLQADEYVEELIKEVKETKAKRGRGLISASLLF